MTPTTNAFDSLLKEGPPRSPELAAFLSNIFRNAAAKPLKQLESEWNAFVEFVDQAKGILTSSYWNILLEYAEKQNQYELSIRSQDFKLILAVLWEDESSIAAVNLRKTIAEHVEQGVSEDERHIFVYALLKDTQRDAQKLKKDIEMLKSIVYVKIENVSLKPVEFAKEISSLDLVEYCSEKFASSSRRQQKEKKKQEVPEREMPVTKKLSTDRRRIQTAIRGRVSFLLYSANYNIVEKGIKIIKVKNLSPELIEFVKSELRRIGEGSFVREAETEIKVMFHQKKKQKKAKKQRNVTRIRL